MDSTNATLLKQLRLPNQPEAWRKFVHLYTPLLLTWSRRMNAADPADVVQDVFLTLLKRLPEFEYDSRRSFRSWLFTLVANRCRDEHRKKRSAAIGPEADVADENDAIAAFDDQEYHTVIVSRAAQMIQTDFSPATWKAFWATAVEDRPVAEVAATLGLSPNAVYLARSRILQRLRVELAGLIE